MRRPAIRRLRSHRATDHPPDHPPDHQPHQQERRQAAPSPATGATPAAGLPQARPLLPPAPRRPLRRDWRFLSELQFLAARHLERTGAEAYTISYSRAYHGGPTPHYYFDDGYHTTSEDAAVNHLRGLLADLDQLPGYHPGCNSPTPGAACAGPSTSTASTEVEQ